MPSAPMTADKLPLRDIHLPPAISWWPPAPGWWLLLLGLILLIAIIILMRQYRQRNRMRRLALDQLDDLERQYFDQANPQELLKGLSRLLRQAAQIHFPQSGCAGLVGEAWLSFLDQQLKDNSFSKGIGRLLENGPYMPQNVEINSEALLELCRKWLKQLPQTTKAQRRQR